MSRWSLPAGYSPREWLKVGRISPTWYRRALAVLVTNGAVLYTLYGIGRMDLAFYALAGAMLVLYGHEFALRPRVLRMSGLLVGQGVSLVLVCLVASAHPAVPLLVLVGSVLAAAQKLACEKWRVGPPRHTVLAFLDLGILFAPAAPVGQLPEHLLTFALCGLTACGVVITPALWYSRGGRLAWSPGDPPVEADPQLLRPALRCLLGVAASGYAAELIGVGRPYWAMVTAAAVFVGTRVQHGQRAMQRTVGTLLGLAVFALIDPLAKRGDLALITLVLITGFIVEVVMTANYWLGMVWLTPMALLITSLPGNTTANTLIGERLVDTLVGSLLGIAVTLLTDSRPHPHPHTPAPAHPPK